MPPVGRWACRCWPHSMARQARRQLVVSARRQRRLLLFGSCRTHSSRTSSTSTTTCEIRSDRSCRSIREIVRPERDLLLPMNLLEVIRSEVLPLDSGKIIKQQFAGFDMFNWILIEWMP